MSYQDRLREEINRKLDELAEAKQPWVAKWIANEICNDHAEGLVENEHRDFWFHCAYGDCRSQVTKCINKRAGDKPAPEAEQMLLPGWKHLQAYYVVSREGEDIGVPVNAITEAERKAKAALYRSMGAACFAHADELDKFGALYDQAA